MGDGRFIHKRKKVLFTDNCPMKIILQLGSWQFNSTKRLKNNEESLANAQTYGIFLHH